jgi:N-acetylneuraminic acid mutarotase
MLACVMAACKKDKAVTPQADTQRENYTICADDSWVDEQDFQSIHHNLNFVYNNKVYVPQYFGATGYPGSNLIHIYDGTSWTEIPCTTIPFSTFNPLISFSIGSKGYASEGFSSNSPKKFYEYNILTNTWTRKADFPGKATFDAYCFTINGKGYVVGGDAGDSFTSENWEYNPATNTWTKRKGLLLVRAYGRGFSLGNKGYILCGQYPDDLGYLHGLAEYDPATDQWTNKAPLPGDARTRPAVFVIDGKAYAGGGLNEDYDRLIDFYRYSAVSNSWTRVKNIPSVQSHVVSFTLNNKGYVVYSKPPVPPGIPSSMIRYNPEYCVNMATGVPISNGQ